MRDVWKSYKRTAAGKTMNVKTLAPRDSTSRSISIKNYSLNKNLSWVDEIIIIYTIIYVHTCVRVVINRYKYFHEKCTSSDENVFHFKYRKAFFSLLKLKLYLICTRSHIIKTRRLPGNNVINSSIDDNVEFWLSRGFPARDSGKAFCVKKLTI